MQFGTLEIGLPSIMVMMITELSLSMFYKMLSSVFVVILCLRLVPSFILDGFSLAFARL